MEKILRTLMIIVHKRLKTTSDQNLLKRSFEQEHFLYDLCIVSNPNIEKELREALNNRYDGKKPVNSVF